MLLGRLSGVSLDTDFARLPQWSTRKSSLAVCRACLLTPTSQGFPSGKTTSYQEVLLGRLSSVSLDTDLARLPQRLDYKRVQHGELQGAVERVLDGPR